MEEEEMEEEEEEEENNEDTREEVIGSFSLESFAYCHCENDRNTVRHPPYSMLLKIMFSRSGSRTRDI